MTFNLETYILHSIQVDEILMLKGQNTQIKSKINMAYKHNDALYTHRQRAFRFRRAVLAIVLLIVIVVLAVLVDWVFTRINTSDSIVSKIDTSSVQSANVSVYRTKYYQFQAPEDWVVVSGDSTENKFVYVKNTGSLITQKLVVYVNRPIINKEADFKITRVLPVVLSDLGNLIPESSVSTHCKDSLQNYTGDPIRTTFAGVSFVCALDSQQYNILIGERGDNENLKMTLNDGTPVTFTIIFSDLTAYPGPGDIFKIASSFTAL